MENVKGKILIVDDENSNIMALTHILSKEYKVFAAKSGEDAIYAAKRHQPDIILLDVLMPKMDGHIAISELRSAEETKNIPVIFITGLSSPEDEEKGLALGAADYISKPFSPAIVKLRINNQMKMLEQLRTIERMSLTDQLTQLPNRRSFDSRLNMEWRRALREKKSISILMIDIDYFKIYNDTYGHQQGDSALKTLAEVLRQALKRPGDFAARWGGEEFIVLLPDTDLNGGIEVALNIRKCVEEAIVPRFDTGEPSAGITVSIGVNSEGDNTDQFISRADTVLYSAKAKGRNRVCCFENL